jgi:hypothetical protein
MKHTEEQLKRALVDALPDKLTYHQFFRIVGWKWENRSVTPHEWPAIVGMIEDRLMDEQWHNYRDTVRLITLGGVRLISQYAKCDLSAKWQTRAQALADIGAIKVKEESK